MGDPELIFLDEPTTGFDPAARRRAWDVVRDLRELGKTVFLTTHYLDEAQALCDRVSIVKDGRLLATGAPAELDSGAAGRYRVTCRVRDDAKVPGYKFPWVIKDPDKILEERREWTVLVGGDAPTAPTPPPKK